MVMIRPVLVMLRWCSISMYPGSHVVYTLPMYDEANTPRNMPQLVRNANSRRHSANVISGTSRRIFAFGQMGAVGGGEARIGRVAVEGEPGGGAEEADEPHDDEHPAPTEHDHQQRQERGSDGLAEMVRAGEDADRRSALARRVPAPHDLGARGQGGRFADAEEEAGGPELRRAAGQSAEALREGPHREPETEQQA